MAKYIYDYEFLAKMLAGIIEENPAKEDEDGKPVYFDELTDKEKYEYFKHFNFFPLMRELYKKFNYVPTIGNGKHTFRAW
jgi:hypothetical protein